MKTKKKLSDKEQLILGWKNRIKHHQQQLLKTKKFHREVEAGILKKIRMEKMQLKALQK